jgi:hypothetical protein
MEPELELKKNMKKHIIERFLIRKNAYFVKFYKSADRELT